MNANESRLSGIDTHWSIVRRAHDGDDSGARHAQRELLNQYGDAIRRYLAIALGSSELADEVFQEFAMRFVRGDLKSADPERGRFRSFVKTAVYRLIVNHYRQQKRLGRQGPLVDMVSDRIDDDSSVLDREFDRSWRDELLATAWASLESLWNQRQQPHFVVLRLCAENEHLSGSQLAESISTRLDRSVSESNARQMLHRARLVFADHLLRAVENSLDSPNLERLEDELIALDLHDYCRIALAKRRT